MHTIKDYKRRITILTDADVKYLEDKYRMTYDKSSSVILVKPTTYNRTTAHSIESSFSINSDVKKLTIDKEIIRLWLLQYMDRCSLIKLQNEANKLLTMYQEITIENLNNILNRNDTTIRQIN